MADFTFNTQQLPQWGIAIVDDGNTRKQTELSTKGRRGIRALRKTIYRKTQLKRWV